MIRQCSRLAIEKKLHYKKLEYIGVAVVFIGYSKQLIYYRRLNLFFQTSNSFFFFFQERLVLTFFPGYNLNKQCSNFCCTFLEKRVETMFEIKFAKMMSTINRGLEYHTGKFAVLYLTKEKVSVEQITKMKNKHTKEPNAVVGYKFGGNLVYALPYWDIEFQIVEDEEEAIVLASPVAYKRFFYPEDNHGENICPDCGGQVEDNDPDDLGEETFDLSDK
jgi:hypothetical protein